MKAPPAARGSALRRRPLSCVLVGALILTSLAHATPALAQACPTSPAGLPARAGTAGATSSARPEDASLMTLPVVPGQVSQVYIRLVGSVPEPGDVSFAYTFHVLDRIVVGSVNPLRCEETPVASGAFTLPDVPGPSTLSVERPIFVARQNLDVVFHIKTSGFEAAAWEIEVYPCGHGGWLC